MFNVIVIVNDLHRDVIDVLDLDGDVIGVSLGYELRDWSEVLLASQEGMLLRETELLKNLYE